MTLILVSVFAALVMTTHGYYSGQKEYRIGEAGDQYTITVYYEDYVRFNCGMKKIHLDELPRAFNQRDMKISKLTAIDCALPVESLQSMAEALGAINITDIDLIRIPLITRDDLERAQLRRIKVSDSELATDAFAQQSRTTWIDVKSSKFQLSQGSFIGAESLTSLSLIDCNITQIPRGIFKNTPSLLSLNLENNLLTEITNLDFEGLGSLSELYIDENRLTLLPNDLFKFMPNAYMLRVKRNPLREITRDVLRDSKVSYLTINDNTVPLTIPPRALADLPLRFVELVNDSIDSLPEDFLDGSNDVQELLLSNNNLEELPAGVFRNKPYLHKLMIPNNHLRVLLPATFAPLSEVTTLNLDNNDLTEISSATFSSMNHLSSLSIAYNKLRSVAPDAFPNSLEALTLNNNQLTTLETTRLPINYLLLQNNLFSSVPSHWPDTLPNLSQIFLNGNAFTQLTESDMAALSHYYSAYIYLEDNKIKTIHVGANTTVPSKLELKNVPLRCDCNLLEFATQVYNYFDTGAVCEEPEALRGTSVRKVSLTDLICQATFSSMNHLSSLSIASNKLHSVAPDAFPNSLEALTLNNNQLTTLETTRLPINYLLLQNNLFSSVPSHWPDTLPNLSQIFLNGNAFTQLTESDMAALSHYYSAYIYLEDNKIKTIHVGANTTVPSKLELKNVPLRCDCNLLEFATQVYDYFDTGAVCEEPEALRGTSVRKVSLTDLICQ